MGLHNCDDLYGNVRKLEASRSLYGLRSMLNNSFSGPRSVALYLASLAEVGEGRTLTRVEITAIAWAVNIVSGIINTIGTKAIGGMSSFNVWWTLGGTFVLVITLLVKAPTLVRPKSFLETHQVC